MKQLYNEGRLLTIVFRRGDVLVLSTEGDWFPIDEPAQLEPRDVVKLDGFHGDRKFEVVSLTPSTVTLKPME